MKRLATFLFLGLVVTACSKWSIDTEWKSGAFRLIAIDTKSQMSLIHEDSSVSLVGPTIFAVGADEKHIVLKQHPAFDAAGTKFDRAVTHYFIVERDKSVRGPLKKEEFDQLAVSLALPSFTKRATGPRLNKPGKDSDARPQAYVFCVGADRAVRVVQRAVTGNAPSVFAPASDAIRGEPRLPARSSPRCSRVAACSGPRAQSSGWRAAARQSGIVWIDVVIGGSQAEPARGAAACPHAPTKIPRSADTAVATPAAARPPRRGSAWRARMHPAKVTHAVLPGRRHVLQIPPQKLRRTQRALPALLRLRVGVVKHHVLVIGGDDALVADRGACHIPREILYHGLAGACRLAVHHPGFAPRRHRHHRVRGRHARPPRRFHPGAKHRRQLFDRQQPVGVARGEPAFAVRAQSAAGHDVMHVRMMLELPAPGVQHAHQPQLRAEQARLRRDLLQRRGALREERVVQQGRVRGKSRAQLRGHRERHQKIRHRQQPFRLLLRPRRRARAAATRTRPVPATVIRVVRARAVRAAVDVPAQRGRAA
eukprot:gene29149-38607_t